MFRYTFFTFLSDILLSPLYFFFSFLDICIPRLEQRLVRAMSSKKSRLRKRRSASTLPEPAAWSRTLRRVRDKPRRLVLSLRRRLRRGGGGGGGFELMDSEVDEDYGELEER